MNKEIRIKEEKIKLLSDKPTTENKFAHEKVANAISDLILEEDGGNTIALTGYWGSGKSSIIEMIKTKLAGKVFIFDAWVHEGDPLRRAFLESIIHFFLDQNVLDKKYWGNKLEEIAKRKETNKSKDSIEPTALGIILFIVTLTTPFGLVLLNLWPDIKMWILILGLILSLLPTSILLFIGIKYFFEKDQEEKRKIISILINQSDKTVTSTTYKTNDPTSIEFQQIFFDLLEVVNQKNGDKFLIVIDNLDRIDTDDALKIWATMRTFFDFDKVKNYGWLKNTWLLVPYDASSLRKLWRNEENEDEFAEGDKKDSNTKSKQYLVNSFTEKTFQITFETPLPIISDSAKYFEDQLSQVFNQLIDTSEKHKIYRIFETLRNKNIPTTPREIKLFINNLTSTFRQWSNEIPPHIQALYIMLRKNVWQNDSKLIDHLRNYESKFLDETLFEVVDKQYREYLASLYFNVKKDKALQILLRKEIETALIKADLDYLKKNQSLPGFSIICENIITSNRWAKEEPNILATATYSLSTLTIEEDNSLIDSWNFLKRSFYDIQNWKTVTKNAALGLCAIIRRENSEDFSGEIVKKIADSELLFSIKKQVDEDIEIKSEDEVIKILNSLAQIINQLIELNQEEILKSKLIFNSSASVFNEVIFHLTHIESFKKTVEFFKSNSKSIEISNNLVNRITDGIFTEENWFTAFMAIYNNYSDISLVEIISAINKRLREQNLSKNEVGVLIRILIYLKNKTKESENALNSLTIEGFIPGHFSKSLDNYSAVSCLYCIVKWASDGNLKATAPIAAIATKGIQVFINIKTSPSDSKDLLQDYINLLLHFSELESVFLLKEINKDLGQISEELIRILVERPKITEIIKPHILINNEYQFYNALEKKTKEAVSDEVQSDYQILIEKYISEGNLMEEIINHPFNKDLASLYLSTIKVTNSDKMFNDYLKDGLNNLSKEDLEKEITAEYDNAINLIIEMVKKSISPNLKTSYMDLLISKVDKILANEPIEELISSNWINLTSALDQNHKNILLWKIRFKINSDDRDFSKVFMLFGDELLKGEIFEVDINDVVNEGFSKIIDRKNINELAWLRALIDKNPNMFKNCNHSSLSVFKDKLSHYVKESKDDDQLNEQYKGLAKLFKVKIKDLEES